MKRLKSMAAVLIILCMTLTILPTTAFAACSHTSLGTRYSEAAHPHKYYRTCNSCGVKVYTGGQETKKHGSGAYGSGTCKQCGTHSYGTPTAPSINHPHQSSASCACGDKKTVYVLQDTCTKCKTNLKTASNSQTFSTILSYIDQDLGIGTSINVPIKFKVYYQNTYNIPSSLSGGYFSSTGFATFNSYVSCSVVERPTNIPMSTISAVPSLKVDYYNSSNAKALSQTMTWNYDSSTAFNGKLTTLSTKPSYTISKGTCSINSSFKSGELKTYF